MRQRPEGWEGECLMRSLEGLREGVCVCVCGCGCSYEG